MRIAAAKQPGSMVTERQPLRTMAEPLQVAVVVEQLQISLWEHERRYVHGDDALVSQLVITA